MANSVQFFDYPKIGNRSETDWGTSELQRIVLDPTVIRAPTFLLK